MNDFRGFIYFVVNKVTGKYYVGQTTRSVKDRWIEHVSCKIGPLSSSIRKYGRENFEITQIYEASSIEDLNSFEIFLIHLLDATNPEIGYNIHPGGAKPSRVRLGRKASLETRVKQSAAHKLRWAKKLELKPLKVRKPYIERRIQTLKNSWAQLSAEERKMEMHRRMWGKFSPYERSIEMRRRAELRKIRREGEVNA